MPAILVGAVNVIPLPKSITLTGGSVDIGRTTAVLAEDNLAAVAAGRLIAHLQSGGVPMKTPASTSIRLARCSDLGDEGYRLTVNATGIVVEATSAAGFFYAVGTLLQMMQAPERGGDGAAVPCGRMVGSAAVPMARHHA